LHPADRSVTARVARILTASKAAPAGEAAAHRIPAIDAAKAVIHALPSELRWMRPAHIGQDN